MGILTAYISRRLALSLGLVTAILTLILWMGQSLKFTHLMTQQGLGMGRFLALAVFLLPDLMALTLPLAFGIACTLVYYRLSTTNQLTVAQSLGFTHAQLVRPVFFVGVPLVALLYSITLYFSPASWRQFKDMEFRFSTHAHALMATQQELVSKDGLTVYVRERTADNVLHEVLIYDQRDPNRPFSLHAEKGLLVETPQGPHVVLEGGDRVDYDRSTGKYSRVTFDRYESDLRPGGANYNPGRARRPYERYIQELLWPAEALTNPSFTRMLRAEGHQRLTSPLLSLLFGLLSFLAIIATQGRRRKSGRGLMRAAVVVGIVQGINLAFYNLAGKQGLFNIAIYATMFALYLYCYFQLRPTRANATQPMRVGGNA